MMHASPSGSPTLRLQRAAESLAGAARAARAILLTGPTGPDGDSIGACLALARGLRHVSGARIDVAGTASYRYEWMPGARDMVPDEQVQPDYDLVVVLDGDAGRLEPTIAAAFAAATTTGLVDHHRSTGTDGYDIFLVDHDAASTCDFVYDLLQAWHVPIDREIAQSVYAGMVYDTGGFRHSNTTPSTHRRAAELLSYDIGHPAISTRILVERSKAGLTLLGEVVRDARFYAGDQLVVGVASHALSQRLGAGVGDLEGIVDMLVYVTGVELACLFIERGPAQVKLSLRSRERVDVAALARALAHSGGGHARASGAMLDESLAHALERVIPALVTAVAPAEGLTRTTTEGRSSRRLVRLGQPPCSGRPRGSGRQAMR